MCECDPGHVAMPVDQYDLCHRLANEVRSLTETLKIPWQEIEKFH